MRHCCGTQSSLDQLWRSRFSERQPTKHVIESIRLNYIDTESLLRAFLGHDTNSLDPPRALCYEELRDYLSTAHLETLSKTPPQPNSDNCVLLDDRRHKSPRAPTGQLAGDEDHKGEVSCSVALSVKDYFDKTKIEQRHKSNAERRTMFVSRPDADCLLAIAATTSPRSTNAIREFFQRYLLFNAFVSVNGMGLDGGHDNGTFSLEFHIPYYSVRKKASPKDPRKLFSEPLRKSWALPVHNKQIKTPDDHIYYESKTSFILIGSDDFCWTSMCFVDGPPGSEKLKSTYLSAAKGRGKDPATGGDRTMEFPYWSPREYFLVVFVRRIQAAAKEFQIAVHIFDARIRAYNPTNILDCGADCTGELSLIIERIESFRDAIRSISNTWESFCMHCADYFEPTDDNKLREEWKKHINSAERSMHSLRRMLEILDLMYQKFYGMFERVSTSMLLCQNEELAFLNQRSATMSEINTRQGDDLGLLTKISALFLPLNLAAAIFSMNNIPVTISWIWQVITAVLVVFVTYFVVSKPRLLSALFRSRHKPKGYLCY